MHWKQPIRRRYTTTYDAKTILASPAMVYDLGCRFERHIRNCTLPLKSSSTIYQTECVNPCVIAYSNCALAAALASHAKLPFFSLGEVDPADHLWSDPDCSRAPEEKPSPMAFNFGEQKRTSTSHVQRGLSNKKLSASDGPALQAYDAVLVVCDKPRNSLHDIGSYAKRAFPPAFDITDIAFRLFVLYETDNRDADHQTRSLFDL
jgi:hypothetical protein